MARGIHTSTINKPPPCKLYVRICLQHGFLGPFWTRCLQCFTISSTNSFNSAHQWAFKSKSCNIKCKPTRFSLHVSAWGLIRKAFISQFHTCAAAFTFQPRPFKSSHFKVLCFFHWIISWLQIMLFPSYSAIHIMIFLPWHWCSNLE